MGFLEGGINVIPAKSGIFFSRVPRKRSFPLSRE
jgi:hypothetical protein